MFVGNSNGRNYYKVTTSPVSAMDNIVCEYVCHMILGFQQGVNSVLLKEVYWYPSDESNELTVFVRVSVQ